MELAKEAAALEATVQHYRRMLSDLCAGVPEIVLRYTNEDRKCRHRAAELLLLVESCRAYASKPNRKLSHAFQVLRSEANAAEKYAREWRHRDGYNWYHELFAKRYVLPSPSAKIVQSPYYSHKRDLYWDCMNDSYRRRREAWGLIFYPSKFWVSDAADYLSLDEEGCASNQALAKLQSFENRRRAVDDQIHLAMCRMFVLNRVMILERYTPLCPDLARSIVEEWVV